MTKKNLTLFSICFTLAVCLLPAKLFAAPYYEGKTIRMLVGHEVGGGYDKVARIIAPYIPKYIPGKPTLYVENMPGGGSVIASNYLYHQAKPDGLTIGSADRGLPFAQLLKSEGIAFDLRKFLWLGSPFADAFVFGIRGDLPYKSYSDLLKAKAQIYIGTSGPQTSNYQYPSLLKEYTGLNCNLVVYKSTAAISLAIERKEVDGTCFSFSGMVPFIDRGLLRPMIRGSIAVPGTENLPVDENLTTSKVGKAIFAMFTSVNQTGRPFLVPPGTPPDLLAILRTAFAKACEDPELQSFFKKLNFPINNYIPQEEIVKMLKLVLDQPPDVVKAAGKFIKF